MDSQDLDDQALHLDWQSQSIRMFPPPPLTHSKRHAVHVDLFLLGESVLEDLCADVDLGTAAEADVAHKRTEAWVWVDARIWN